MIHNIDVNISDLEENGKTKAMRDKKQIVEDLIMPRCVMMMAALMAFFVSVLIIIILLTWFQFVDINIVQYLSPICHRLALLCLILYVPNPDQ